MSDCAGFSEDLNPSKLMVRDFVEKKPNERDLLSSLACGLELGGSENRSDPEVVLGVGGVAVNKRLPADVGCLGF